MVALSKCYDIVKDIVTKHLLSKIQRVHLLSVYYMLGLHQVHKITGLMGFWGINIQLTYGLSLMTPEQFLNHAGLPVPWLTVFYLMFSLTCLYQS